MESTGCGVACRRPRSMRLWKRSPSGKPLRRAPVETADGATTAHPGKRAPAAGGQDPGETPKTCPSAPCKEGALLLGVVAPDGTVAYVQPPTRVSAEFVDSARSLGHPERRFRFASTCVEAGCPQWTGSGCGVIDI